ncbi:MAG: tRNA 2-thiouridine(34) synthase MnmA [Desulfobacterales bacterium]|nr:tRNA 2-thiouridine(34) synthase MnmA [Desulfobacterales bacterium]
MKPLTAIAISGGVDSMMAAYRLRQQGHAVIGIHFLTGYETALSSPSTENLSQDRKNTIAAGISELAGRLEIPFRILDLSSQFKEDVIRYFIDGYEKGRTPNPCMVCNPQIKFGALLDFARTLGAECLATGHYARIRTDDSGRCHLLRGVDRTKDQSYFLAFLRQDQLCRAVFPLGEFTKTAVKEMAALNGLKPLSSDESQDICFIKGLSYGEFLARQPNFTPQPGPIADVDGNVIGRHNGLHLFTIGQRRGINCPSSEPYYVLEIDKPQNRLIVGFEKDLGALQCRVTDINWINGMPPPAPLKVKTRVRYRHSAAPSVVTPIDDRTAAVTFDEAEAAITPGQGAVFYQGDEVLGGGWIA